MNRSNINLIVPGGFLRHNSQSLVGPIAEKGLRNLNVDKVFLGADGVDSKLGLYTPNLEEAQFNERMIEISDNIIALVDSSKFSRKSFAFFCEISKVSKLITDSNLSNTDRMNLAERNVEIIEADK